MTDPRLRVALAGRGLPFEVDARTLADLPDAVRGLGIDVELTPAGDGPVAGWVLTLLGDPIGPDLVERVRAALAGGGLSVGRTTVLAASTCLEMSVVGSTTRADLVARVGPVAAGAGADLAVQAEGVARRVKRLVVLDVDSTLVDGEVIDELARAAGCVDRVAAITARAMAGELAFEGALRERVALLAGTPIEVLDEVHRSLSLMPGARRLIAVLRRQRCRVAIVSGGFTFFTERLRAELDLDFAHANELELEGGRLTGRVVGEVVDGARKAALLRSMADALGADRSQVVAVGDGANDLAMLAAAGLGIAYRAKPILRSAADVALDRPPLDAILHLLGLPEE